MPLPRPCGPPQLRELGGDADTGPGGGFQRPALSTGSWRDAVADERGLRRFGARLASLVFLRRAYRKAARRHPAEDALIRQQLSRLAELEAAHSDILDAPADAFATLLTCLASLHPQVRVAQQLLYHVGRFIYLVDVLDDLPGDCKRGSYNPLRYRFSLQDGALTPADRAAAPGDDSRLHRHGLRRGAGAAGGKTPAGRCCTILSTRACPACSRRRTQANFKIKEI